MCGIAGLLAHNLRSEARGETVAAMAAALAHRGPDDHGLWLAEPGIALAHRRLSILDLSELGHQPMLSASGRYAITYNGEIYNFHDLRRRLESEAAADFVGTSDTEVLLEAIEQWGFEKTLQEINGMFAFGVWDKHERQLRLARDRMGEKPLYFAHIGERFYFASELSAFFAAIPEHLTLNLDAVGQLLRYNCIPAPHTIYKEIQKLPPAHHFTVHADSSLRLGPLQAYWQIPLPTEDLGPRDESETLEQLESLLLDSVQSRMVSDVPIGAFLSGGVDSSLVTALMQKRSSRKVRTFSIGFENKNFDESEYARTVAGHLGTDHTELFVTDQEIIDAIPRMAQVYSEPFSDSSQVPTYLVAALTRRHVTVALSGDGGDELFGGYDRYAMALKLWKKVGALPSVLRQPAGRTLAAASPALLNRALGWSAGPLGLAGRGRSLGEKLNKAGGLMSAGDFSQFYSALISQWRTPQDGLAVPAPRDVWAEALEGIPAHTSLLRKMMLTDQRHYLPEDILVKVDRASMAVGLETRVPFLDHRLVEFAARLPQEYLLRGKERKWALRQILDRHVPRALIDRPKMGFTVPLGEWLRGPLRNWADDLLSSQRLKAQGIFAPDAVAERWSRHRQGRCDDSHDLWPILMFQAWQLERAAR